MDKVKLSIYSIVGDKFCVAAEDGEKVYSQLEELLKKKKKVEISFLNVEMLTSAFLNTAIGKLYGTFKEEEIKESLVAVNISEEDKHLLKRVVDTAKAFYKEPERLNKSFDAILEE